MPADKRPLSETKSGFLIAVLAGIPGGPIGVLASPLVLYLLTFILRSKKGEKPNRFLVWSLIGIMGVPVCLLPFSGSSQRTTAQKSLPPSPSQSKVSVPSTVAPTSGSDVSFGKQVSDKVPSPDNGSQVENSLSTTVPGEKTYTPAELKSLISAGNYPGQGPAVSEEQDMGFEQCVATVNSIANAIGNNYPNEIIVDTAILRVQKIWTNTGTFMVSCSAPDRKRVITTSKYL